MTEIIAEFDTGHMGAIHDCELDYYGKKLATTSSDHTIKIWDLAVYQNMNNSSSDFTNNYNHIFYGTSNGNGTPHTYLAELKAHEGPVWQVSWAHPKFGVIIASCSYDKKVIVWREIRQNDWRIVHKCEDHSASVNTLAWASWEYGLLLACGSSDGYISVHSYIPEMNIWSKKSFQAHPNGVNAVSWCPSKSVKDDTAAGGIGGIGGNTRGDCSTFSSGTGGAEPKIVSGGCDNQLKIWKLDEISNEWIEIHRLENKGHTDWVRDVSWRPFIGLSSNYIASCSEDYTVIVWYQESDHMQWMNVQTINMHAPVWKVSWSITGNVLAVASGDRTITLFKEGADGKFEAVVSLDGNSHNNIEDFNEEADNNISKDSYENSKQNSNNNKETDKIPPPRNNLPNGNLGRAAGGNLSRVTSSKDVSNRAGGDVTSIPTGPGGGGPIANSRGSLGSGGGNVGGIGGTGMNVSVSSNSFSTSLANGLRTPEVTTNGTNPNLVPSCASTGGISTPHPPQQSPPPCGGVTAGAGMMNGGRTSPY